jgi:small subunit ribosomal protein S20
MANIRSQLKRIKQNEKRRVRNRAVRSELKTRVKTAERAARDGSESFESDLRIAQKRIDQAATKGVIHKNKAARDKARLMRRTAAASSEA